MPERPELLAPAGSWEAMVAAVNNGADAVYLGGKLFSARAYASNFDNEEMNRAVEFCHLRGVKLYVTVNTLVADLELEGVIDYLKFLYETGVDAVIIQDLGVLRLARKVLPGLELHASTQMTVNSLAGVELLQEQGFKRIVLARETSLADIREIKEKTGADLEVFIHGALCVCYSGQCLISSLIGGRSGNRGRCAQPCRLAYTMVDRQGKTLAEPGQVGKHLLSPRDLNMLHHIPDLVEAGINSFKVEGRMKRPEYVATVIRVYRHAIDRCLENPDFYEVSAEDDKALWQIFNRDFTTGYFYGKEGHRLMSYKRPNNRGIKLGRVTAFNGREKKFEITLEEPLHLGDGVEAWVTQGGRQGTIVRKILKNGTSVEKAEPGEKVWIELPGRINIGDRIFKTNDALLMEKAAESYTSARAGARISLECKVTGAIGEPLQITFIHPEGYSASARTDFIAEKALKRPLTADSILKQVERLGNTPFEIGSFSFESSEDIMVPVSEINEARRKAVESMEGQIIAALKPEKLDYADYQDKKKETLNIYQNKTTADKVKLSVTVGDIESLKESVAAGADVVYISGDQFRSKPAFKEADLSEARELCQQKGVDLILQTPRLPLGQYLLLPGYFKNWPGDIGVLCTNLGFLKSFKDNKTAIMADYSLNIYNSQSLAWFRDLGAIRATISPELNLEQIRELAPVSLQVEYMVHGALPMMISEYCAPGSVLGGMCSSQKCQAPCQDGSFGLKDRLGMVFPVETDRNCRMHIFNPKELCLVEDIGLLAKAGVSVMRIEGKKEKAAYLAKVVAVYRAEIDRFNADPENFRGDPEQKEKLNSLSPEGITKGHLYRGVI